MPRYSKEENDDLTYFLVDQVSTLKQRITTLESQVKAVIDTIGSCDAKESKDATTNRSK